jgi:DnaJ-class molecular chaperone
MPGGNGYAQKRKTTQQNPGPAEQCCSSCNGTGFPPVRQPEKLGRRIFPAACIECRGKGRIRIASTG